MTLATEVIATCDQRGLTVATAESLTGGLLCAALVDVPGASRVVRGGLVAYTPEIKIQWLDVSAELIGEHGTVHREVASQMAQSARGRFDVDRAVSTTGVAGPGSAEGHEAGTVFIAVAGPESIQVHEHHFPGDRAQVRSACVDAALSALVVSLEEQE